MRGGFRELIRFLCCCGLAAGNVALAQVPQADGTGTLVGLVTIKDANVALPYSVVSIERLHREQFTNERGVFRIMDLPIGAIRLRVRHVGYSPADIEAVVRDRKTDTSRVP